MPRLFAAYPPRATSLLRALPLALLLWAPASEAFAQGDNAALLQRLQRLEADLQILQRQVNLGPRAPGGVPQIAQAAPAAPGATAALEVRVSQLEDQMQSLTGQVEEMDHDLAQMKDRLDRLSKDIDARLGKLEQSQAAGVASQQAQAEQPGQAQQPGQGQQPVMLVPPPQQQAAPVLTPPPGATPSPALAPAKPVGHVVGNGQVLPLGTPQQQYDYSLAFLKQQDYDAAEVALKAFVNTHPDDQLAGAAQYWLGETYYIRGNFQDAASAFATGYEKFPKGVKAPDSLLKLGMSLGKLNRKKDACDVYASLAAKYPAAPATLRQSAARERKLAGCG